MYTPACFLNPKMYNKKLNLRDSMLFKALKSFHRASNAKFRFRTKWRFAFANFKF